VVYWTSRTDDNEILAAEAGARLRRTALPTLFFAESRAVGAVCSGNVAKRTRKHDAEKEVLSPLQNSGECEGREKL